MIKIGPGLGSMYFSARKASGPATLTITFGDPSQAYDGEFFLTINNVRSAYIPFGDENVPGNVGTYDVEGLETFLGNASSIAQSFYNHIVNNFSSSLNASMGAYGTVTLTTKATGPTASLSALCELPIFPNISLGSSSEQTSFDFASIDVGGYLLTPGVAKYITIADTAGNNHYFWFSNGVQSDPAPAGSIGHIVNNLSGGDEPYQVAEQLVSVASATGLWSGFVSGDAAILTMKINGAVTNATAGNSTITTTVLRQGVGVPTKVVTITLRKTTGLVSAYPDNYKLYSGTTLLYDSDWYYTSDLFWYKAIVASDNTLTVVVTLSDFEANNPYIISLTNNTCGAVIDKSLPLGFGSPPYNTFNLTSFTSNGDVQLNFGAGYSP